MSSSSEEFISLLYCWFPVSDGMAAEEGSGKVDIIYRGGLGSLLLIASAFITKVYNNAGFKYNSQIGEGRLTKRGSCWLLLGACAACRLPECIQTIN